MISTYLLKNKEIIPCEDIKLWSQAFFSDSSRFISKTRIGENLVSTVFLGINHGVSDENPIVFETIVFDSNLQGDHVFRSSDYEEAEEMHQLVCRLVLAGQLL